MQKIVTFIRLLKSPRKMIVPFGTLGFFSLLPSRLYLRLVFRAELGYSLDLKNPQTFNEKLQWIKLYDRNPLYTKLSDKYEVREHVKEVIGESYLIPCLGVYDSVQEIDWDLLPSQFVLKCNHDSGSVVICKDKLDFDRESAKRKLRSKMRVNSTYRAYREWPYKNIKRRIICETFISEDGEIPEDYKVFCFDGEPKLVRVDKDRFSGCFTHNYFSLDWSRSAVKMGAVAKEEIVRPVCLDLIINLSRKLSEGIPHVRVDWYIINGQVYFGEYTFFNGAGFEVFDERKCDLLLGSWIHLPKKRP